MANVNRLGGFRPVKHLNGSPYNGAYNLYEVVAGDGTALNVGDLVKADSGTATDVYPTCVRLAASGEVTTGLVLGAVVGFVASPTNLDVPQHRVASTKRYAMVADDPSLIFECADGSTVPTTLTLIGNNTGVQCTAPNTTTGVSPMTTGATTATTTDALPLKIMGIVHSPDNEAGAAYQRLHVMINQHYLRGGQTAT
jgi:hypothetical protein